MSRTAAEATTPREGTTDLGGDRKARETRRAAGRGLGVPRGDGDWARRATRLHWQGRRGTTGIPKETEKGAAPTQRNSHPDRPKPGHRTGHRDPRRTQTSWLSQRKKAVSRRHPETPRSR